MPKVWYNIIKERKVLKMRKPRLSKSTIERLYNAEKVKSGKYEYEVRTEWSDDYSTHRDFLCRWDENNNCETWELSKWGLWELEK